MPLHFISKGSKPWHPVLRSKYSTQHPLLKHPQSTLYIYVPRDTQNCQCRRS
jgi:hypothetical protein